MNKISNKFLFATILFSGASTEAAIRAHYKINSKENTLSSKELIEAYEVTDSNLNSNLNRKSATLLRSLPYYIGHGENDLDWHYEEWEFSNEAQVPEEILNLIKNNKLKTKSEGMAANEEVRVIRSQGPKENRINLTVLGDGYTLSEKERFFDDVEWMTKGLFETATFQSYLPLFNVYAVFVPSNESGIGDGRAKDTAFRLYRNPAGSKRAIMPGNEAALSRAMRLAPATSYPIVLANDDYYGGLGGRWAISTRSRSTGLIVLRHELGHNFGEVGEEYDNGMVYSGANASRSSNVPWAHWLENPNQVSVNEAKLLTGDYVWKNLSTGAYKTSFNLPARTEELVFDLSSVGWSSPREISVKLNGEELSLDGVFHDDRSFFTIHKTPLASQSQYSLEIKELVADGDNVLGFALAYALPPGYNLTPDKVGAFASYDSGGRKSYRPTHNSCLMKDMRRENFCSVDQENMWLKFLARVSLIDELKVDTLIDQSQVVLLKTQDLGNSLNINWFYCGNSQNCTELDQLQNQKYWVIPSSAPKGKYRVNVGFETTEIRLQSRELSDSKEFVVR